MKIKLKYFQPFISIKCNRNKVAIFIKYLLYHILSIGLLIGLSVGMFLLLGIIYLNRDIPVRLNDASLLKMEPALSIVPRKDSLTSLIRFRVGWKSTFGPYIDDLFSFVQNYEDHNRLEYIYDCESPSKDFENDDRYSCKFPLSVGNIGCNIGLGYGYDETYPCIIIRLNRIIGWVPQLTKNINETYRNGHPTIKIKCDGVHDSDKQMIKDRICYYDEESKLRDPKTLTPAEEGGCSLEYGQLRHYYFPYKKQESYQSPFVWVKFLGLERHTVIMIECWAEADNIDKENSAVRFEFLID